LININELKKSLNELEKKDLIRLITDMAQTCPQAKEYLTIKFAGKKHIIKVHEDYKDKIEMVFYPTGRSWRLNLQDAKSAISDFKRVCKDKNMIVDLMLLYVEECVAFTNNYGDINEAFYNSAGSMYANVIKEINKENVSFYRKFADRLFKVANNAPHGWGFYDEMMDLYNDIIWLDDAKGESDLISN